MTRVKAKLSATDLTQSGNQIIGALLADAGIDIHNVAGIFVKVEAIYYYLRDDDGNVQPNPKKPGEYLVDTEPFPPPISIIHPNQSQISDYIDPEAVP